MHKTGKSFRSFSETTLKFKEILYDEKQNRQPLEPIDDVKIGKVRNKIKAEQSMRDTSLTELIPCLNCRKLLCGRHFYRDKKEHEEERLQKEHEEVKLQKEQDEE